MIGRVGFEELRCFVAVGLFVISISLDCFDRFSWVVGGFCLSVLELDVVLVWFG
jgi:hypothetical protein